jgi:hypothetical protein
MGHDGSLTRLLGGMQRPALELLSGMVAMWRRALVWARLVRAGVARCPEVAATRRRGCAKWQLCRMSTVSDGMARCLGGACVAGGSSAEAAMCGA